MAKSDEPQLPPQGDPQDAPAGATSRVFKAKDVHRRRAAGKAHANTGSLPPVTPSQLDDSAEGEGALPDAEAAPVPLRAEQPAQPAGEPSAEGQPSPDGAGLPQPQREQEPPENPESDAPHPKPKQRIRAKRVALVIAGALVIAAVAFCTAFAWNRWGRYDDHADMQGQWYVRGTTVPVSIGEGSIRLTDDVSYEYAIDDHDKTIRYAFGPMEGRGRYRFSDDRQSLAIADGEGFTGAGNALADLVQPFSDFADGGSAEGMPEGEGVTVLCREPGWLAALVEEAAEHAAARAGSRKARQPAAEDGGRGETAEPGTAAEPEQDVAVDPEPASDSAPVAGRPASPDAFAEPVSDVAYDEPGGDLEGESEEELYEEGYVE